MAAGVINLQKESGGVTKITSTDGATNTEVVLPENGNIVSVDTAVTDNSIARYDGTTGKLQNSGVIIDDTGNVGIGINPSAKLHIGDGSDNSNSVKYTELLVTSNDINWNHSGASIRTGRTWSSTSWLEFSVSNGSSRYSAMTLDTSGNLLLTSGTGALGYGTGAGGTVTQLTSKSTAVTLNKQNGTIITSNSVVAANTEVGFVFNNSLLSDRDNILITPSYFTDSYSIKVRLGTGLAVVFIKNISGGSLSDVLTIKFAVIKGSTN